MNDNDLSNVMSLIKKQKWENLFKRRELMPTAACKEFYANLTVFIYKKKEIAKSRVKGVEIEFDSMKLASILDVPGHTVKDHELPYGDWMSMIFDAFGVPLVDKKGEEPKRYDYFEETFLTICKLRREDGVWWVGTGENRRMDDDDVALEEEIEEEEKDQTEFDWEAVVDEAAVEGESGLGIWWIGSGENRRRDDDEAAPEEEAEGDDEGNKDDFDREAIIDEATVEGESESDDQFYDAQVGEEEPVTETPAAPAVPASSSTQAEDQEPAGVDPSGLTGRDAEFLKFQAEFERKRANRFHDELEKAKAENAKLLALLHKTQTKPHP
ncbi:hypothetical protein Dimus_035375 [Dionaea muscipula]